MAKASASSSLRGHDPLVADRESDEGAGHEAEQHTDRDSLCERRNRLGDRNSDEWETESSSATTANVAPIASPKNGLAFENRRHPRQHANSAQDRAELTVGPVTTTSAPKRIAGWSFPAEKKMRRQRRSRRWSPGRRRSPDAGSPAPDATRLAGRGPEPLEEDDGHRERHQLLGEPRPRASRAGAAPGHRGPPATPSASRTTMPGTRRVTREESLFPTMPRRKARPMWKAGVEEYRRAARDP